MKDSRAPVIVDVLYSLEWFVLVSTSLIPFLYMGMGTPRGLCAKLMITSAAYVACALAMRVRSAAVVRFVVPAAAAVGCVLLGSTTTEKIILGVSAAMAIVCGNVIFFGLRQGSQAYSGMLFLSALLAVMAFISRRLEMSQLASDEAAVWVAALSALYVPLCIASVLLNRLQDALCIFEGRSEQPVTPVKKRVGGLIFLCAAVVFVVMLAIPQAAGGSFLGRFLRDGAYLLVGILIILMNSCHTESGEPPEEMMPESMMGAMPPQEVSSWDQYLLSIIAAAILLAAIVAGIVGLVRVIRNAVLSLLSADKGLRQSRSLSGYDTVERINAEERKNGEKKTGRDNASKIRRIYKKRISAVLGSEKSLRGSLTPSEIARLCKAKGEDVSKLTALYCKARYTRSCTDEDLKTARRL